MTAIALGGVALTTTVTVAGAIMMWLSHVVARGFNGEEDSEPGTLWRRVFDASRWASAAGAVSGVIAIMTFVVALFI